jgi:antitoxin PrlF
MISEAAMPTKVTSNGRVTIPKRGRDSLGIEPGTEGAFRRVADGSTVIERADGTRPPSRFEKLCGIAGPGPSTDEIMVLLRGDDP